MIARNYRAPFPTNQAACAELVNMVPIVSVTVRQLFFSVNSFFSSLILFSFTLDIRRKPRQ